MKTNFSQFHPDQFSFADDPVLVIEDFWSLEERKAVREAMPHAKWIALVDMPPVAQAFPNCGNWLKAEIGHSEVAHFIQRVRMSCVADYVESFPIIKKRHVNFNFYSYGAGDCLSTYENTDDIYSYAEGRRPPTRRLALVTFFHEEGASGLGRRIHHA